VIGCIWIWLADLDCFCGTAPGSGGAAAWEDGASEYSEAAIGAAGAVGRGAEGETGGAERSSVSTGGGAGSPGDHKQCT